MKSATRYAGCIRLARYRGLLLAVAVCLFLLPSFRPLEKEGNNIFRIFLNGAELGTAESAKEAWRCLSEARRRLCAETGGLLLSEAELSLRGEELLFGETDDEEELILRMEAALRENRRENVRPAYTVKINTYTVNLASVEEVRALLQAALDKYSSKGAYTVSLEKDTAREFNVFTPVVMPGGNAGGDGNKNGELPETGVWTLLNEVQETDVGSAYRDFDEFELGLVDMSFKEKVEIVENVLSADELTDVHTAIEEVTKEADVPTVYEVVSGDTLSGIAIELGITIEQILSMNAFLESENSLIRIGDELTITVPEPELSVLWKEREHYEEDYEADIVYIPNDEWYTNQTKTLQQPSAGHREVIAVVAYRNNDETGTEIEKEDVLMEAVPKIVERGTKIPPSYIRPVSGGRISSGFGSRKAPTKGASTYHKGVDFAVPIGTAVMASCGGTVVRAGWASGLGNSVTISHPDGRQTVYGHLSKVLVSAGQSVSQGQKIALSGNTGVSTGPHLHFSMIIGGTYVNPLNYLQ